MKYARIEVNDNWADEMDIEYVTYMPMSEWKKLEKKIEKYTAFIQVPIGTNEDVEYDGGSDYLEHCCVTEVDKVGNSHGFDSLNPEGILEGLKDAQAEERRVGKVVRNATRYLKKLYHDVIDNYEKNKKTKYAVHLKCANRPRGYFNGVLSKGYDKTEPLRFSCGMKEVHFIEQDGKIATLLEHGRMNDIDKAISEIISNWRINHYQDYDLKGLYNQTLIDNQFLAKVEKIEMIAVDFWGNNQAVFNKSKVNLDYFKSHALEFVNTDYYQTFDTKEEAENVIKMIDDGKQDILNAGYEQSLKELEDFVNRKKEQYKALYAQEVK